MAEKSMKAQLLDLLHRARADEVTFVDSLAGADLDMQGTIDHWSAKDTVAHLTLWRTIAGERLGAVRRGETPPKYDNYLEVNDQGFESNRHRTWQEVLSDSQRAFQELVASVEGMSQEELTDPERYERREGEPLWSNIRSNGFDHPISHISQYYLDRGEKGRALAMQRDMVAAVSLLDPSPRARGTAVYNLGCFLALNGEHKEAIERVRESFALRPDLLEWSKQDSDLNSLRELPEFKALYRLV